jgi:hypothetical protein
MGTAVVKVRECCRHLLWYEPGNGVYKARDALGEEVRNLLLLKRLVWLPTLEIL